MGRVLSSFANISGVVPHISIVFGNCAGGSAIAAAMSDFVIMNAKNGKMFVTGPDIIEATEGSAPAVMQREASIRTVTLISSVKMIVAVSKLQSFFFRISPQTTFPMPLNMKQQMILTVPAIFSTMLIQ